MNRGDVVGEALKGRSFSYAEAGLIETLIKFCFEGDGLQRLCRELVPPLCGSDFSHSVRGLTPTPNPMPPLRG